MCPVQEIGSAFMQKPVPAVCSFCHEPRKKTVGLLCVEEMLSQVKS
jgi:hypothetical protein